MSYIYKLSHTRAIACAGRYSNPLFSGSSLNRRYERLAKEKEQEKAHKYAVEEAAQNCSNVIFEYKKPSLSHTLSCTQSPDIKPANVRSGKPYWLQSEDRATSTRLPKRVRSMSARTKNKIREKIEALYSSTKRSNFTFLTLTFINKVDDKTAQKCLNKFLTAARSRFGRFNYVWVAERQTQKHTGTRYFNLGNIHFHLITDKYWPVVDFNALWVKQQYASGISHPLYSLSYINALTAHEIQKKLNPFDVKKIKSINGLSSYLTMYVTKNNQSFRCSTWHCSRGVSMLFTSQIISKETFNQACDPEVNFSVNEKTGQCWIAQRYFTDYSIVITIFNKVHFQKKLIDLHRLNSWVSKGFFDDELQRNGFVNIPHVDIYDYSKIYLQ